MPENARDEKTEAIVLLAGGATVEQVARQIGRDPTTVRRWRKRPEFEAEVTAARRALLDRAVASLSAGAGEAVDTLRAALADQSSATRVRAAVALLSALPAIVEHVELSSRITELEARIEGNEQWHAGN